MQDDAGVGRRDIGGHRFTLVANSRSPPPACDAAANGRALVEITDRADPVIAVRHDERESEGEVAANNKNWRQRLSLVDSFQVLVHMRIVAGQKRQFGRPQQVLGGVVHNFRLAEVLDQRADLGIRGDKRKIFPGRLEIRGRPLNSSIGVAVCSRRGFLTLQNLGNEHPAARSQSRARGCCELKPPPHIEAATGISN